jgi:hypothetical protein
MKVTIYGWSLGTRRSPVILVKSFELLMWGRAAGVLVLGVPPGISA